MNLRMRVKLHLGTPSATVSKADLERFEPEIVCGECFDPITNLEEAYYVWRQDRAFLVEGDEPELVHTRCLDAFLRDHFALTDVKIIRMEPASTVVKRLMERLGAPTEALLGD